MRQRRIVPVFLALMAGFVVVAARLVELQGVESGMWLRESERSTVRFQSLPFERGWIMDRNGHPLARTEEVRDLTFRYRGWRRSTVAGQANHAWVTLGSPRAAVPDAIARAEELATSLGAVTVADIAALPSRQHRRDLGFYLERLFGEELWDAVVDRLGAERPAAVPLAELPGWERTLPRTLERAERERQALADLAWASNLLPEELVDAMERAALRADRRVAAGLEDLEELRDDIESELVALADDLDTEQLSEDEVARERYRREQQLRAEFDDDPSRLAQRVSYDTRTLVAIRQAELGGFGIHVEMRRIYPEEVRDVAPLVVGRVGDPQPDDMDRTFDHRLRLSDLASLTDLTPEELDELERLRVQVREVDYAFGEERGLVGIEAAFEELLRGKRGWIATSEQVDRDSVEREDPHRGLNVVLTLDTDLQRACQEVLDAVFEAPPPVFDDAGNPLPSPERWTGAIVLLDPRDGQVLAMATGPRPTREAFEEEYGRLMNADPWVRLRHRAIDPGRSGNLPPPGSTFKPVSALAGLTAPGMPVNRHTLFLCEGQLQVGDRTMGCLGHHGEIGVEEAIARSCNIYFYRLGRAVGVDPLRDMAQRFGFGTGERSGLLLDNEVLSSLGIPVRSGLHESRPALGPGDSTTDAMRLAIGQAPLDDVTPLQVATMMGAVGTGVLVPPMLVAEVEGFPPIPSRAGRPLDIAPSALEVVRSGMAMVVDSEVGTGRRLNRWIVEELPWMAGTISAKTGTAQVGGGKDQAWFAGFVPRDRPRLAFAVLVEDCGLHGSEAAAPVFQMLLQKPAMESWLRHEVLGLSETAR